MSDDDKPFSCTYNGCSMKFVTEDRLSAHKSLHEKRQQLSLNLPQKGVEQLVDQTPTPSRFLGSILKNFEDTGLRTCDIDPTLGACDEDIGQKSNNPFEETFRKASNSPNTLRLKVNLPQHVFNEESLNTPSIDDDATPLPLKFPLLGRPLEVPTPLIDKDDRDETHEVMNGVVDNVNDESDAIAILDKSPNTSISQSNLPLTTLSLQVPVICTSSTLTSSAETAIPNNADSVAIDNSAISNGKRSNNAVTKSAIPCVQSTNGPSLPSVSKPLFLLPKSQVIPGIVTQAPIYQVVVCKLNNGNSLQVLPSVPQVSEKPSTVSVIRPKEHSITVEKLQHLPAKPTIIPIPMTTTTSQVIKPVPTASSATVSQPMTQPSSSQLTPVSAANIFPPSKPGRRSKSAPREDPKLRKARALERNRAAASRCRKKKKVWIETLETNASSLEESNEKLRAEVNKLRNEVALLKSALLEHKDCPVTLRQLRVGGREIGKPVTSL